MSNVTYLPDRAARPSIWFDVEDLFVYGNRRPSGIQRLAFEVYRQVWAGAGAGGAIGFLRHHASGEGFVPVPWAQVEALFDGLTAEAKPAALKQEPAEGRVRTGLVRGVVRHLPERARRRALEAVTLQLGALRAALDLAAALLTPAARAPKRSEPQERPKLASAGAPMRFERGDTLLALGCPWISPTYGDLIEREKARYGVRFAMLVYDIIPIRRPEWFERELTTRFQACLSRLLPLADKVFAISRATAKDVEAFARTEGLHLAEPPVVLPIGSGFGAAPAPEGPRPADLPLPGRYALIVSTIEARKNHALLFRVWRKLLEETPRTQVPTLVFAGRVGWLVDDFVAQMENADWLGGKIVLIEDPSDATLAHLYEGCLFTLFPSHYEGWGLPVSESLVYGKPPVISNRTSLPEAGGDFARYFDPDDLSDAYRIIRGVIEDPVGLREWQARVARDFRPTSWAQTAEALLGVVRRPAMRAQPGGREQLSAC